MPVLNTVHMCERMFVHVLDAGVSVWVAGGWGEGGGREVCVIPILSVR